MYRRAIRNQGFLRARPLTRPWAPSRFFSAKSAFQRRFPEKKVVIGGALGLMAVSALLGNNGFNSIENEADESKVERDKQTAVAETKKEGVEPAKTDSKQAGKDKSSDEQTASEAGDEQAGGEESGGEQGAAFNPDTGEINWDCPCLGGMAHGPCGEEFKEAFSCFVFSETDPKGIDCIKKFEAMRSCFRQYPEHYKEELYDDDDAEVEEKPSQEQGSDENANKEEVKKKTADKKQAEHAS